MASLTTIRRQAAMFGGRYYQATAPSGGHSTTQIVFTATGALGSSMSVDDSLVDYWLYLPAASANDKVRTVKTYTPSTGTLTVERAYSASTVPNSKVVELHGLCMPFSDDLTGFSWTNAINEALKRLYIAVEFTITPTANQTRHSLATTTWITSGDQLLDVGYLVSGETRNQVDPYRNRAIYGEVERDGATLYFNHAPLTFPSNETIYIRAAKRVYDHCRASGGSYGDQSGLSLESDEAPIDVQPVAWGALVEVAENIRNDLSDAGRDHIQARQKTWASRWESERRKTLEALPARRIRRRQPFPSFDRGFW